MSTEHYVNSNREECQCGAKFVLLIKCPICGAYKCENCDMGDDVECLSCEVTNETK